MHTRKRRDIREVLRDNLKRRMEADPLVGNQPLLAARAGVDQGHLSRLLSLKAAATIDLVDKLARACRCQAWELLVDDDATREEAVRRILEG